MATIQSLEQLVAVLGRVVTQNDPLNALEKQGLTLSDSLKQKLATTSQSKQLTQQQRQRVLERLQAPQFKNFPKEANFKIGAVQFPSIARELPEGEYDLIVGIKLDLVNQALASAFDTRAWPNTIKPDDARRLISLTDLQNFSDDIPNLGDLDVGTLEFISAPTTTAASQGRLIVNQPFKLNLDLVQPGSPRVTVSTMKGTIRMHVPLDAELSSRNQLRVIIGAEGDPDLTISRIDIDPDSDIQPRDETALQELSASVLKQINSFIRISTQYGAPPFGDSFSFSPTIHPPFLAEISLQIQRADTQAVPTADNVGALMIGALIGKDPAPAPGTGSPDRLRQDPFQSSITNFYIRSHEALLNKIVQEALTSGLLERLAQKDLPPEFSDEDVDVNSAVVDLKAPNQMRFVLAAELVDFCGPGPFNDINLNFDATVDIEVAPPFKGRLQFKISEPDIDYSDLDLLACAISSLTDVLTVVFSFEFVDLVFKALNVFLSSEGDKVVAVSGVFDPKEPVPGTELLPRIEIVQANVTDETIEMLGTIKLYPDDIHTFVYARLVEVDNRPSLFRFTRPIENATVQAFDQDVPAPQGDDIKIPPESSTEFETAKIEKMVDVRYEPPHFDELLAEGKTNADGQVRLIFNPKTKGGTKITTQTTIFKELDKEPQIHVFETPIFEAKPDLFFRITLPDGKVFDSRNISDGLSFIINVGPGRLGQPEAPLTLSLPHQVGDKDKLP